MITVNKAITRGQLTVNLPVFIIMLGVMGSAFYLDTRKLIPSYVTLLSIVLGPLLAWIYWSFAITRWRIWAFSNVEDVEELKVRAIAGQLIWADGSFFERTEIRTNRERVLIRELEKRFKESKKKKQFVDDPSVPPVTKIFYSKLYLGLQLLLSIVCVTTGVYLFITEKSWFVGTGFTLLGAYLATKEFKKFVTFEPQITIDNTGINIAGDYYPWAEIQHWSTTIEGFGKNRTASLIVETSSQIIRRNIDDYDTSDSQLRHLLKIHKGRFDQSTAVSNSR